MNLTSRGALLALLFLGNPLLYAWWQTTGGLFPDSVAYLLQAKALVGDGHLFVAGFGHVDNALILPPLYPALIGLGTLLYGDAVLVSQWLAGIALLAATVPLYLWIERASTPWMAAGAVAVIQWQPFYFLYGTSTLTEALFILGISLVAYAAGRLLARPRGPGLWFALGVGCGLVFLIRQLGIFLLPTLMAVVVIARGRAGLTTDWRATSALCGALLAGFLSLALPYAAVLDAQTGEMPWTQSYRLNQYVVAEPAGGAAAARGPQASYTDSLVQRRQLRHLTADGTEMLGNLVGPPAPRGPLRWMSAPGEWLGNLRANVTHALALLGPVALLAALFGAVLALFRQPGADTRNWRLLFPGVIAGYVALLSTMTGLVARYIDVLAPFLIALAFVGVHAGVERWAPARAATAPWRIATALLACALFLLAQPASSRPEKLRKYGEQTNPLAECVPLVAPGSGVLSFHPFEPYLLGGIYRVVPNDSLDRIAGYARRTGTRWLLFRPNLATAQEAMLYDQAPWMQEPTELFRNANYAPRCASPDATAVLFEISATAPAGKRALPGSAGRHTAPETE